MNTPVNEYMNRTLVYVQEGDRPDCALRPMLDLGITAVAVLDTNHRPVGMVTLRDLVDKDHLTKITEPASTVGELSTISIAAQIMGHTGYHHLIVTDGSGKAVGMISSMDVVRAFAGQPPHHPSTITKLSRATDSRP